MVAAVRSIAMSDLSRQKRFRAELGSDGLTRRHTVGQAVDHYLDRMGIRDNGLRWTAFSRGVKLDSKRSLADVPEADSEWTVLPEVSAGSACGSPRRLVPESGRPQAGPGGRAFRPAPPPRRALGEKP